MPKEILISGAGIAGCTLAWWLDKYGYAVTLVEQASAPRAGGYVIDFWGLGFDVAERMGLIDELRRQDLKVVEFRAVDQHGKRLSGINQGAVAKLTGGRMMSLPRSAVASALYGALPDRVPVRFGDSIAGLDERPDGVEVTFHHGERHTYDFVVGADGLHSAVRQLAFGGKAAFERFLGYYVAAFTTHGYPHRDPHVYVTYGEPGRQIWRITLDGDATVFLLVFADNDPLAVPMHDSAHQKEVLARRYGGSGWETNEVLRALGAATDLYCDRVSQIAVPRWAKDRVALIGDACACPSLLAGEGSAMAMAEAYTLAGELHAAAGNHVAAFEAYERKLRPYVERKQRAARGFASSFVPTSAAGLWVRNFALNAAAGLGLTRLLLGAQLSDRMALPNYR